MFSGSGQLGIEALSRGAKHCTFVDSSSLSIDCTKENLKAVGYLKKASVFCGYSKSYISLSRDTFDIALLDPPYNKNILNEVLPLVADKMSENGIIICESGIKEELPDSAGDFYLHREYKYGKIKLTAYRKKSE